MSTKVRTEEGCSCTMHVGTLEALVAAGIVSADMFPGQPGRPSTAVRYYKGRQLDRYERSLEDEHFLKIYRSGRSFTVHVGLSEDQRRRRRTEHNLAKMPASSEVFVSKAADVLFHQLNGFIAWHMEDRNKHGFSYDAATISAFQQAAYGLIRILQQGQVRHDRTPLMALQARADRSLQSFLSTCVSDAASPAGRQPADS